MIWPIFAESAVKPQSISPSISQSINWLIVAVGDMSVFKCYSVCVF